MVLTCLLLLLLHAEGLLPGFRVVINDGPEGCKYAAYLGIPVCFHAQLDMCQWVATAPCSLQLKTAHACRDLLPVLLCLLVLSQFTRG
jgi:hypothetical protein